MDSLFPQEQPALFVLSESDPPPNSPTGAEVCALHCALEFRRQYQEQGSPERVSEDLETLCLVCLLLIAEYRVRPAVRLLHELIMCRECLQTMTVWRQYDALPYDICLQLLGQPYYGMDTLQRNFTHGMSGVRAWMFDLAWFVRRHLTIEATGNLGVTFRLLKNVEDTLGYWDKSLALCRSLYPTRETFWSAVALYRAEAMPEQFADRIKWAGENMERVERHPDFLARELQARQIMDAYLLMLPSKTTEQ